MVEADEPEILETGREYHPEKIKDIPSDEQVRAKKNNDYYQVNCWEKTLKPLIALGVTMVLLLICSYFCLPCLFGVLLFSACTCAFIPVMNIPLWATIAILILHGWALTTGKLSLVWG